jgi:hypothetical protein
MRHVLAMAKRTAEDRLKHVALANKMTEVSAIGNNQGITLLGNFRLTRSFRWMQQEFSNDEHHGGAFFELSRLLLIGGDRHPLALVRAFADHRWARISPQNTQ